MAVKSGSKKPSEVDGDDNSAAFAVLTKKNPVDLAVSATKASGKVGDVVKVRVTVRNNGPADANGFAATVALPKGTKLAKVPQACDYNSDRRTLLCNAGNMIDKGGKPAKQDLLLRITSDEVSAGSVKVKSNVPDRNKGNNSARIQISLGEGGGSGGGLPVTGVSLTGVIAAGAVAVVLGGVLALLARRRRVPSAR